MPAYGLPAKQTGRRGLRWRREVTSSPAYRPTRMGVSIRFSPALVVMTTSMT